MEPMESISKPRRRVRQLDLSRRLLTLVPLMDVNNCPDITRLVLSFNRLQTLPNDFKITALEEFEARCNKITTIPERLFGDGFAQLTRLDLSFNKIKTIPEEIGELRKLEALYLSMNLLTSVPGKLGGCTSLRVLDLYGNRIDALPEGIFAKMDRLISLDIGDNSIPSIPEDLSLCFNLTRLHAYGNKIASTPAALSKLTNLVDVTFRWNKLSELPEFLLHTTKLTRFDLSGNPLASLGAITGDQLRAAWSSLERLNFYNSKLEIIPNELFSKKHFPKLQSLLLARTPAAAISPPLQQPPEPEPHSPAVTQSFENPLRGVDLLVDRIKGCIYGNAIGDALGLSTEFIRAEVARHFYGGHHIAYDYILRDDHRSSWIPGDWTDDTDQMLLILDSILEANPTKMRLKRKPDGEFIMNPAGFARRLNHWISAGVEVLGDSKGAGCGATVRSVALDPRYVDDHEMVAKEVWIKSNKNAASNGAVMRTSVLGLVDYNDLDKVASNTRKYCRTTHFDPRALASCIAATISIATILQMGESFDCSTSVDEIVKKAIKYASKELDTDESLDEFKKFFLANSLSELELDEDKSIGYTYKALGCASYALRHGKNFRETIEAIVLEAGDADTNAAIAGAVLGCKLGLSAIPMDLVDGLIHKDWLDMKLDQLLRLMGIEQGHSEAKARRKYYLCGEKHAFKARKLAPLSSDSWHQRVSVWKGDITSMEIDAIVNVADAYNFPEPVGALDQRVHFAAGPEFDLECLFCAGKLVIGGAVATRGCLLPAKYVLHTAPPQDGDKNKLKDCYDNCLDLAAEIGIRRIALPLIGASKLSVDSVASFALEFVQNWVINSRNSHKLDVIVLVAYSDQQEATLKTLCLRQV